MQNMTDQPFQPNSINTNGRIDILSTKTNDLFQIYDKIPVHHPVSYQNPTEGIWINTPLSIEYFSSENILYLQKAIQHGVYKKSNQQFEVSFQDEDQLKIIMRSVFLQYAKNQQGDIEQQINQLNQLVLGYCIPQVYSEALSYKKYLYDVSTMYKPMERPILAYSNDKQLELKPWF
jgi:hypothetical protein